MTFITCLPMGIPISLADLACYGGSEFDEDDDVDSVEESESYLVDLVLVFVVL